MQFGCYRLLNLEETFIGDSKFCDFCIFSVNYARAKFAIPFLKNFLNDCKFSENFSYMIQETVPNFALKNTQKLPGNIQLFLDLICILLLWVLLFVLTQKFLSKNQGHD